MRAAIAGTVAIFCGVQLVALHSSAPASADSAVAGGQFVSMTPATVVNATSSGSGAFSAAETRTYPVLGYAGMPTSGVSAILVSVGVTATTATGGDFVTAYASDASRPSVPTVMFSSTSAPRSNTAIVPVGSAGSIDVYNSAGSTSLAIVIEGYFTSVGSTSGSGGGFVPTDPTTVLDTTSGTGAPTATIPAGGSLDFSIAGVGDVPSGSTSVFADVEVKNATASGVLKLGPGGTAVTGSAEASYDGTSPTSAAAAINLASDGRARITNSGTAPIDVIVSVEGSVTGGTSADVYNPLGSVVLYSTYTSGQTAIQPGETRDVNVLSGSGISADEVGSIAFSVAVRGWSATGEVDVYNPDTDPNDHASLPFAAGVGDPTNGATSLEFVSPSADGEVAIHNTSSAPVNVILAAQGWFEIPPPPPPTTPAGLYNAITPRQIENTTNGLGALSGYPSGSFGTGEVRPVQVTGGSTGIPSTGVSAVLLDVHVTAATDNTVIDAYPNGAAQSAYSFIHAGPSSQPVSNTTIVSVGADGEVDLRNGAGTTGMFVDVEGWFTDGSTTATASGYHPMTPVEVASETGDTGSTTYNVSIAGASGIPSDATAVYANVRVDNSTLSGNLDVAASSAPLSSAPSTVSFRQGAVSNIGVPIALGSDGGIHFTAPFAATQTYNVTIDVTGYFAIDASDPGGAFHPLNGVGIYEGRTDALRIDPQTSIDIPVKGAGLPDDGSMGAVAITIIAAQWDDSDGGSLAVFDPDLGPNGTSNLGFEGSSAVASAGVASSAIVQVSSSGTIRVKNLSTNSTVEIAIAAQGWFGWPVTTHPHVPTDLSFTPCSDDCDPEDASTTSLTPTLQAESADTEGASLTYTWQIQDDDTGDLVTTATTTAPEGTNTSWTVPSGTLFVDHVYDYRVKASDGTDSPWSGWVYLGVHMDQPPDTPDVSYSPCLNDDCTSGITTSTQPVFTGTESDVDSTDLTSDFQLRDATTGDVLASANRSGSDAPTWQPAPGVLALGHSYEYRVGTSDGTDETWTDWTPITTQAPPGPQEATNVSMQNCENSCAGLWVAPTSTPTFSATSDAGTTVTMTFEVESGSDTTESGPVNVVAGATGSWTVPSGVLGPDDYAFRIGTASGGPTTWTAWRDFSIDETATTAADPSIDQSDYPAAADGDTVDTTPGTKNADDDDEAGVAAEPFTEADQDALDALKVEDEGDAANAGLSANDADLDGRRVTLEDKYAPRLHLADNELFNPLRASLLIGSSTLKFAHDGGCPDKKVKLYPTQAEIGEGSDYKVKAVDAACIPFGPAWRTWDEYVDVDSDDSKGGPAGREGYFLDLDKALFGSVGFDSHAPAYEISTNYPPHPSWNIVEYWFAYAYNEPPPNDSFYDHHEGDWEHVSILFDAQNRPRRVLYNYHGKAGCTLPWAKAPVYHSTHPEVEVGEDTHADYPLGEKPPLIDHVYRDTVSTDGPIWNTDSNLLDASARNWWGYNGNWGDVGVAHASRTGPTGPGVDKDAKDGSNMDKAGTCSLAN